MSLFFFQNNCTKVFLFQYFVYIYKVIKSNKAMTITNITYDGPTKSQSKDLPTEMTMPSWLLTDMLDCEDNSEVNQLICDYISDETGWCVYDYEVVGTCKFNNIEGYDGEFLPFNIEDLKETIQDTFGLDKDGELYVNHDERYFEYTESDYDIEVSGNF